MARLLFLGCSQRKTTEPTMVPALHRYDGPLFAVLRRYLRESAQSDRQLDVYILSGKFGLIRGTTPIPYYDQRLRSAEVERLRRLSLSTIEAIFATSDYDDVFVCLGADYHHLISGFETLVPAKTSVTVASGSIGRRQADLRDWLWQHAPLSVMRPTRSRRYVRLRGIEFTLSREQVREAAHRAIEGGDSERASYHVWYAEVDGRPIGVKRLVSELTGLPVRAFTSQEARRVLVQLGLEPRRL